jgi:hypothetical protein
MNMRKAFTVGAVLLGAMLGSTSVGFSVISAGNQQCYYRIGIDPENSCTRCSDSCLGAGYQCCTIIVG